MYFKRFNYEDKKSKYRLGKISVDYTPDKGFVYRIHKNYYNSIIRQPNIKMGKNLSKYFNKGN